MFKKTKERSSIEILFPIVLFLLFTIGALFIILYSARTYQHIVEGANTSYNTSTQSSYITQKIRSYDAGKVSVGKLHDLDALILSDTIDSVEYVTYIYHYNGKIRELFTKKESSDFAIESGMPLFDASGFSAQFIDDRLLMISIANNEAINTQYINIIPREVSNG